MMTMKRERCHAGRRVERTTALAAALILALASPRGVDAQANTGPPRNTTGDTYLQVSQTCEEGVVVGQLGISGLNCRGECTITLNQEGAEQYWSFTTEPMITGVEEGSPAEGALEAGDILVAIDGVPITTAEGGYRFANVEPGEEVTLLVRRDNVRHEVTLQAAGHCRPAPNIVAIPTRLPQPPPEPYTRVIVSQVEAVVAPRVRVVQAIEPEATTHIEVVGVPGAWSILPRGKLGFSFSCGPCSSSTDPETGETIWSFSGPVEVIGVTRDGPADMVGIERGDLITTIGAEPIESEEGGIGFSRLTPGEAVELTVVKRSGEEVEVTVVPVTSEEELAPPPAPVIGVTVVEPVTVVAVEAPPASPEDPDRMILRFSGTVGPAEVEVRGGPVDIIEQREEGIIIVITRDTRIQIRVPRNWQRREDGPSR